MNQLSGITRSYRAFAIKDFIESSGQDYFLVVLSRDKDISEFAEQLRYLLHKEVLEFPAWDCLPYDRISPSRDCINTRVQTLTNLVENNQQIVVTSLNALGQNLPPRISFVGESLALKKGQHYSFQKLISYLSNKGFNRVSTVYEVGEYAVRGDIIDFFPSNANNPYRIDFFGEEIEKIRQFESTSQTTIDEINQIEIKPVQEIMLESALIAKFKTKYREQFPQTYSQDPIYTHISEGHMYAGFEHWLPLFFDTTETLLEYISPNLVFIENDAKEAVTEQLELLHSYYEARILPTFGEQNYRALSPEMLYWSSQKWEHFFQSDLITISPFEAENSKRTNVQIAPSLQQARSQGNVFEQLQNLKSLHSDKLFVVTAQTNGSRNRIEHLLREHEVAKVLPLANFPAKEAAKTPIYSLTFPLDTGFVTNDYFVLSEQDILGERIARKKSRTIKNENFFKEISELNIGDFVVHKDHGIGQYQGLLTVDVGGQPHDCLSIEYADKNRLLLPVENLELLSRYGSDDTVVTLDKLGTAHWQNRKAKVKKRLLVIADYLIKLAAERSLETGECFDLPKLYEDFCARFPYPETDDQLNAIEAVTKDLASGKPMDRLVCGDVGFGKTEVALRASFLVAAANKQVVIVTPTTLLCRQHYQNFSERFKGFGVRVRQLSRLVKPADAKLIQQEIANGEAHIVIATHAVLSEKVKFHDLGLVIVDEEQHFGVKQKEKLKKLKPHVHILTLTATPIPRTLQLALTGVRELSLISTPPVDRLSVKTFVMPFDGAVIREALLREYHRGGQSFFVVPRIEDLKGTEEKLKQLLPDFKIAVAHGQLSATELEAIITDVCERKYDILLATNIIESGIDMPWVNTIIIHRADRFGLAQLYQLRGRVGRTKIQAYAYLTLPENAYISEVAKKRLEVMQSLDHLGAGFSLASYDMDIRGAGNIVGEEQSGHIKEVGVELYQTLLNEAILQVRAEQANQTISENFVPQINLGISLLIPETYVSDLSLRLGLYRRLSNLANSQDIHSFAAEIVDRFGKMPKECENLLKIIELKMHCKTLNIEKIDAGPKGVVIGFYQNNFQNPQGLLSFIQSNDAKKIGEIKLRPDQKIAFLREGLNDAQRIAFCLMILKALQKLNQ
jgi:transcription-repair coupling factor (superfamily II helicase)